MSKKNKTVEATIIEIDDEDNWLEITWKIKGMDIPVFSSFKYENRISFYASVNCVPGKVESLFGKKFFARMFEDDHDDLKIAPETLISVEQFKEQCEEIERMNKKEEPVEVLIPEVKPDVFIPPAQVISTVKVAAKKEKPKFTNFSESGKLGASKKILKVLRSEMQKTLDRQHIKDSLPDVYETVLKCAQDLDEYLK